MSKSNSKSVSTVGRPRVYNGNHRRQVAALVKRVGAREACRQLQAKKGEWKTISLPTILSICREEGVELLRGRRPNQTKAKGYRRKVAQAA